MSIASEITRIQTANENIKTSIINKGGTLASNALLGDYAAAIDNMPISAPVTESLSITENGTYDVTSYASAVVDVSSADYTIEELAEGLQPSGAVDLGNAETIAQSVLSYRLALTSVTGLNVTNVQMSGFAYSAVESVILPFVTTVGQYIFQACKGTKNPAHFSNEREKVCVNDSKEKKEK